MQSMLINAFFPVAEFGGFFAMRLGLRCFDRGFSCNKYKTKKKTSQGYANLYSGPEYMIHFKYSTIMNVSFVTLMYGSGLPLLYPIALTSYIVLYCIEKCLLLRSYKMPPEFDEKLSKSALRMMRWASILAFGVGYWMLSNQQIFYNTLAPVDNSQSVPYTQHIIFANVYFD